MAETKFFIYILPEPLCFLFAFIMPTFDRVILHYCCQDWGQGWANLGITYQFLPVPTRHH
jgi:hypothetical protein